MYVRCIWRMYGVYCVYTVFVGVVKLPRSPAKTCFADTLRTPAAMVEKGGSVYRTGCSLSSSLPPSVPPSFPLALPLASALALSLPASIPLAFSRMLSLARSLSLARFLSSLSLSLSRGFGCLSLSHALPHTPTRSEKGGSLYRKSSLLEQLLLYIAYMYTEQLLLIQNTFSCRTPSLVHMYTCLQNNFC